MERPTVLVVGETPSLGRSVTDLLESADVRTQYVGDLRRETPLSSLGGRFSIVVAASSGYYCATARQWIRGELPNVRLVVVGSRDPVLTGAGGVEIVALPLEPGRFLEMIRGLLVENGPRPRPGLFRRSEVGSKGGPGAAGPLSGGAARLPTFK